MNYNTSISTILLALFTGFCVTTAEGAVVIKVRAINPLEEEAPVTIHYPLPAGLTPEDVLAKRVARGKGLAVPADFEINFGEDEKVYFVDYLITLAPKEIVVLEVEAKDIWTVPQKTIDGLKEQVEDLLKAPPPSEEFVSEEARPGRGSPKIPEFLAAAAGPDPVALKLKEEISRQLEEIIENQKVTAITQVGALGHIEAYQKNRETLQQVGMDITMLRNMIAAAQETQQTEENPQAPPPAGQGEADVQDQAAPSDTSASTSASGGAGGGPAEQKQSVVDKFKSLFRWK